LATADARLSSGFAAASDGGKAGARLAPRDDPEVLTMRFFKYFATVAAAFEFCRACTYRSSKTGFGGAIRLDPHTSIPLPIHADETQRLKPGLAAGR
jgi:hypothetical protein